MESPQAIYAGAAIFTGMRITLIQFILAELTRKAMPTAAGETVNSIHTRSIVETRCLSAIWDVTFTVDAVIARRALACVAVHVVSAATSIPAGIASALVHFLLTALTIETSSALAQEPAHFINTRTSITTWIGAAVINISLAVDPTVSRLTFASVAAHCVTTITSILTWVFLALVYILSALGSFPSAVAQAGVAGVIQGWLTNPSSLTGLRITGD